MTALDKRSTVTDQVGDKADTVECRLHTVVSDFLAQY